ncbi:MAG: hypothetical protein V4591_11065 [Bdellovibrionota bacterium]
MQVVSTPIQKTFQVPVRTPQTLPVSGTSSKTFGASATLKTPNASKTPSKGPSMAALFAAANKTPVKESISSVGGADYPKMVTRASPMKQEALSVRCPEKITKEIFTEVFFKLYGCPEVIWNIIDRLQDSTDGAVLELEKILASGHNARSAVIKGLNQFLVSAKKHLNERGSDKIEGIDKNQLIAGNKINLSQSEIDKMASVITNVWQTRISTHSEGVERLKKRNLADLVKEEEPSEQSVKRVKRGNHIPWEEFKGTLPCSSVSQPN